MIMQILLYHLKSLTAEISCLPHHSILSVCALEASTDFTKLYTGPGLSRDITNRARRCTPLIQT